jgi:hypothetical protein
LIEPGNATLAMILTKNGRHNETVAGILRSI